MVDCFCASRGVVTLTQRHTCRPVRMGTNTHKHTHTHTHTCTHTRAHTHSQRRFLSYFSSLLSVMALGPTVILKPGLQYTQETGAKPRDFARTQAKKCLQTMRVCLQNFPVCVTSQLVAQTTKESDHSFTVEFTTRKCTSTEENKMALACKKEDRIGFSFFVRCFVCGSLLSSLFLFLIFCRLLLSRK